MKTIDVRKICESFLYMLSKIVDIAKERINFDFEFTDEVNKDDFDQFVSYMVNNYGLFLFEYITYQNLIESFLSSPDENFNDDENF